MTEKVDYSVNYSVFCRAEKTFRGYATESIARLEKALKLIEEKDRQFLWPPTRDDACIFYPDDEWKFIIHAIDTLKILLEREEESES